MNVAKTSLKLGEQTLELEIGRFAQQATSAVLARLGDTVVHATIVMSGSRDDIDWFPLQVEYQEKLYAGGKIKGSRWVKREGRPSDEVVLKARLIDRSIRPLFPEGFKNEVQIIVTVLSADGVNDADIPAMFAVSTGLALSSIPWNGPIGAIRLGYLKSEKRLLINPTYEQRETSDLDLIVSASKDAVVMVEAGASEVSEAEILEAFDTAKTTISSALNDLDAFINKHAAKKIDFTPALIDKDLLAKVKKDTAKHIPQFVASWAKLEPYPKADLVDELYTKYEEAHTRKELAGAIDYLMKQEARAQTIKGTRPDNRKADQIRPLSCEVGVLPRTHGSAVFQRGQTQALTITTLGSPSLNQLIESMEGEEEKRYIHHYYMPPFSVGEAGRMGWPSRREVGHGALAERALEPMIPSEEDFPYTIHVVSEIMSSNGSTSMASVCGSTLSLMDAGVPLKKPVSGIAMGLIQDGDNYIILSDIQGLEDHTGDMDFKVAGTTEGITAMQMDIKISGIPMEVLKQALAQARVGRLFILDTMLATLGKPRESLSPYAPKIATIKVPVDKIGEVIGPGGKMIKSIIAETGAEVDIDDDGSVFISSTDDQAITKAKTWITNLVREVTVGEQFEGKVVRVESYGAFVNILPGKDGLLHVSQMSTEYVADASSMVKLGDMIKVRVNEVSSEGKISLTTLTPQQEEIRNAARQGSGRPRRGEYRGRPGSRRPDRGFRR
jgi:polyribonucleotide nucleotidyltransferase